MPKISGSKLRLPKISGSKLRGPQIRAPQFLQDLFGDLRDRRLLPLVIVLVVAVVAVPLALRKTGSDSAGSQPDSSAPSATASSSAAKLTVVSEDTQVRDYRKRLLGREKNPFEQKFTGPQLAGSELNESTTTTTTSASTSGATLPDTSSTSSTTSTSDSTSTSTAPTAIGGTTPDTSSGSLDSGDGQSAESVQTVTYAVDVRIVRNGKKSTRRNTRELAKLPSEKVPVLMFMGASRDGAKALFLVSDRVNSVFGDVHCLSGTDSCQLLQLEPGLPVTFVYGAEDHRYRIKLLKIERKRSNEGTGSSKSKGAR